MDVIPHLITSSDNEDMCKKASREENTSPPSIITAVSYSSPALTTAVPRRPSSPPSPIRFSDLAIDLLFGSLSQTSPSTSGDRRRRPSPVPSLTSAVPRHRSLKLT
ncbi:uncharacterized protein A4U43_C02F12600 [Asparagus officinalis]|uniref:Uncharacterized protein n=1 Tax=Asparagus officinalis TaxID=4686 RepID=A0A5P1FKK1_ASPOF|nr:uncharacterized protein A4U43_C02F12600 [Asparagus officinalis]